MSLGKQPDQHDDPVSSETSLPETPSFSALEGAFLIAFLTLAAYLPSLSGGFLMDDNLLLTDNDLIKSPNGLYHFWFTSKSTDYWPLTNTSLWLEWRLWGLNPTGYHVANLLLHMAAALLVWTILRKLSIPGAYLAALLFAVHPVNVESVAWIAQRKNTLAMVFFLLSILWYLLQEEQRRSSAKGELPAFVGVGRWYCLSLLAFLLAMLSKGSVAFLPLVLLGLVWWQRRQITTADLARTAPFFLIAAALVCVNIWFQSHGSAAVYRTAGFAERLAGAGAVVWFYLSKALLPIQLAYVYPQWHIQTTGLLWWLPLLALFAVTVLLVWQRCSRLGRPLLFAWGFFCAALVPVLGFIDVGFMQYSLVADHYLHIALIGVVALVAAAWSVWHGRALGARRLAATAAAAVLVSTLLLCTWQQNRLYAGPLDLYLAALEKNPDSWLIHNNLGALLNKSGQPQEAIKYIEQALLLKPDYALAHYNLGVILYETGRPREAIVELEHALQCDPSLSEAHNDLGIILAAGGQTPEGIAHFEQAFRLRPDYVKAHANLAMAYAQLNSSAEALTAAQKALDMARSQRQTALADKIEAWLTNYRAQQPSPQDASTPPGLDPPLP